MNNYRSAGLTTEVGHPTSEEWEAFLFADPWTHDDDRSAGLTTEVGHPTSGEWEAFLLAHTLQEATS